MPVKKFTYKDMIHHNLTKVPTNADQARAWLILLAFSPLAYHIDDDPHTIPNFNKGVADALKTRIKKVSRYLKWDEVWDIYHAAGMATGQTAWS